MLGEVRLLSAHLIDEIIKKLLHSSVTVIKICSFHTASSWVPHLSMTYVDDQQTFMSMRRASGDLFARICSWHSISFCFVDEWACWDVRDKVRIAINHQKTHFNCYSSYKTNLILLTLFNCQFMSLWVMWVEVLQAAVCRDQGLGCQV